MSPELEEIYNHYLSLSEKERVRAFYISSESFMNYLDNRGVHSELATQLFIAILSIFVDADNGVSDAELSLINEALKVQMSKKELAFLTEQCGSNKDLINRLDEIIDALPNLIKADVVVIGLSLISSDGELTDREIEIFEKILN